MDPYIDKMRKYEREYAREIALAEQEFRNNGNKYTKEQCVHLQNASMCQCEMANISNPEEKRYHQDQVNRLNKQIAEIVKILDPAVYEEMTRKKKRAYKPESTPKASSVPADKSSDDDIDVEKWFKEAPTHDFKDVAGMDDEKEELLSCVVDVKQIELRKYLGIPNLHSYLFIGPPGCGKTYIIEAFAAELIKQNYKYLSVTGSDILNKFVGEAEKIVARLFEEAEKNEPCIIFIDEIDGVCKNRSIPNLPEYASSLTTAFLNGYNRINSSDKNIIFIGATNYPTKVDNAMLDRVTLIKIPMPDEEARRATFIRKIENRMKLDSDITYEEMSDMTETYNYRDINRLDIKMKDILIRRLIAIYGNQEAAIEALKSGEFRLNREIFEQARKESLPTPKDDILREQDEWELKFRRGDLTDGQ